MMSMQVSTLGVREEEGIWVYVGYVEKARKIRERKRKQQESEEQEVAINSPPKAVKKIIPRKSKISDKLPRLRHGGSDDSRKLSKASPPKGFKDLALVTSTAFTIK